MPLCGAVTKLTRLSPNTDGCTLRTLAAAAPTVWGRLGGGIDSGRKESRKTLGRGRLAPIHADAVVVGESLYSPYTDRWRLFGWLVGRLVLCALPQCTYFQTSNAHRSAAMDRFFQSLCARDILVINDACLGGGDESPID
ncbi:hypothetical protein ALC60_05895 [Trachymyrmex zeteki]|uniref:Uncharacterized protein n=1 Tax=Mycetomoellerius zeteki TaxID=64791 RepID=A0A151X4R0_9HYME|nr:hypothetical protein ALC60_05895 [Trachymyrmex zeteki]